MKEVFALRKTSPVWYFPTEGDEDAEVDVGGDIVAGDRVGAV